MPAEDSRAIWQWLRRPYVGQRYNRVGPRLTNFTVLGSAALLQLVLIYVVSKIPAIPLFFAGTPGVLFLAITVMLWLNEPGNQRYKYDD